jgi:hypothetical protein
MITRKLKTGEMFYADMSCGDRPIRLITALTPDGWIAGVLYLDTKDWVPQGVWPDVRSAEQQAESYMRQNLGVAADVLWTAGPPASPG